MWGSCTCWSDAVITQHRRGVCSQKARNPKQDVTKAADLILSGLVILLFHIYPTSLFPRTFSPRLYSSTFILVSSSLLHIPVSFPPDRPTLAHAVRGWLLCLVQQMARHGQGALPAGGSTRIRGWLRWTEHTGRCKSWFQPLTPVTACLHLFQQTPMATDDHMLGLLGQRSRSGKFCNNKQIPYVKKGWNFKNHNLVKSYSFTQTAKSWTEVKVTIDNFVN